MSTSFHANHFTLYEKATESAGSRTYQTKRQVGVMNEMHESTAQVQPNQAQ